MRRSCHLLLVFTLFFNSAASSAFVSAFFNKAVPDSYLASNRKLSPCEINFVKLLNGKLPAEIFGTSKTSLWSEDFIAKNYLDEVKSSETFKYKAERVKFLQDLTTFVHRDEIYLKNIANIATMMRNEGLVSLSDLRKVFTEKNFEFAKFIFSQSEKRLMGSLDIDPEKSKLIESLISKSNLGKNYAGEYRQIMRVSSLSAADFKLAVKHGLKLRQDQKSLGIFRQYIEFLEGEAGKLSSKLRINSAMKNIENIYGKPQPHTYDVASWFKPHKRFLSNSPEHFNREEAIKSVVNAADVSPALRREYKEALRISGLTQEQIEFAHKNGMVLRDDEKSLRRFTEYLVYLDYLPSYKVMDGLKNIEKIYAYGDNVTFYVPEGMLEPHKQFVAQRAKILKYEEKRLDKIQRQFKLEEKERFEKELDDLLGAKKRGEEVDEAALAAVKKEINNTKLSSTLMKRAQAQASGEASIFRRLVNGCNGGGSAKLASAAKKFKRFKLALSIGGTPLFYLKNNWDKKEEDPYFWERLGHEMAMGIFFTVVSNKIVTNTNKGFWSRYLEGYIKFGAMDVLSAGSYDLLFGQNAYIRFFQQLYNGGVLHQTDAEKKLEELRNSPTFEEDVNELISYLDKKSEDKNFKNLLDKNFNLSTYSSLDDDFKITQEDLNTEEAREVMLELLAERMYLEGMGEWPVFQSGNTGMDRWSFYRLRNIGMDAVGMGVSLAMFEIMCRYTGSDNTVAQRIGAWGAVFGLQIGYWMVTGDATAALRREAINQ